MDSLKECLNSHDANEALRQGILDEEPDADIITIDASDGGEGFVEAMHPDKIFKCMAHDALMRPIETTYGMTDAAAILDVARIIGLSMIEPDQRRPLIATSFGVGEVMLDALRQGAEKFIIGLGGTATSDCGLGMLQAIKNSWNMAHALNRDTPVDTEQLKKLKVTLATDVDAPLTGPHGAAHVFAPQKGASPKDVELLERRALTFANMAAAHLGYDRRDEPGAGAAGGLGYAFLQFMDAHVQSGAELILEQADFDTLADDQTVVVTGEGHADKQTLMGKLPLKVLQHALQHGACVVLVAGRIDNREELSRQGFCQLTDINAGYPLDDDTLKPETARERLRQAGRNIARNNI